MVTEIRGTKLGYTPQEFVLLAIRRLHEAVWTDKDGVEHKTEGKGIHTVYSKFNALFRAEFPTLDPVKTVDALVEKGVIEKKPVKGGVRIYVKGEMKDSGLDAVYDKMTAKS